MKNKFLAFCFALMASWFLHLNAQIFKKEVTYYGHSNGVFLREHDGHLKFGGHTNTGDQELITDVIYSFCDPVGPYDPELTYTCTSNPFPDHTGLDDTDYCGANLTVRYIRSGASTTIFAYVQNWPWAPSCPGGVTTGVIDPACVPYYIADSSYLGADEYYCDHEVRSSPDHDLVLSRYTPDKIHETTDLWGTICEEQILGHGRSYLHSQARDGNFFVASSYFCILDIDMVLGKFTPDHDLVWARKLWNQHNDHVIQVMATPDGGAIILNDHFGTLFRLLKVDSDGMVGWSKSYTLSTVVPRWVHFTQDGSGKIYLVGTRGASDLAVLALNSDGTSDWVRTYTATGYDLNPYHIAVVGPDALLITGSMHNSPDSEEGLIVKIEKSDGDLVWSRKWDDWGLEKALVSIPVTYTTAASPVPVTDYLITGNTLALASGDPDYFLLRTDQDGDFISGAAYPHDDDDRPNAILRDADGFIVPGWFISQANHFIIKTTPELRSCDEKAFAPTLASAGLTANSMSVDDSDQGWGYEDLTPDMIHTTMTPTVTDIDCDDCNCESDNDF